MAVNGSFGQDSDTAGFVEFMEVHWMCRVCDILGTDLEAGMPYVGRRSQLCSQKLAIRIPLQEPRWGLKTAGVEGNEKQHNIGRKLTSKILSDS